MPVSDYPGRTVLVGFFVQKQDAGTLKQREQFSQELFDKFDAHIVAACTAANPPVDPSARVRASIAVMAQNAPGGNNGVMAQNAPGGNNGVKARRAVEAYLTFRGL